MKTTTVNFGNFVQDAMTIAEMNYLKGGGVPNDIPKDLLVPPRG